MLTKFLPGWYIIYTRPLHEKKVASELAKRGLNVFLATTKILRKWHDRNKIIDAPLFPSYVFVFLESHGDYFTGKGADGVVNYVKFGNEIAKVNESIVSNLRIVLDHATNIEVLENIFNVGQHFKITQGSLNGLSCEIAEYKNDKKILVRVNLLNRTVLATVSSMNLA